MQIGKRVSLQTGRDGVRLQDSLEAAALFHSVHPAAVSGIGPLSPLLAQFNDLYPDGGAIRQTGDFPPCLSAVRHTPVIGRSTPIPTAMRGRDIDACRRIVGITPFAPVGAISGQSEAVSSPFLLSIL